MGPCRCSLIPPTMLDEIARRGTEEQRRAALRTLAIDQTLRSTRLQRAARPGRLSALATGADRPERTIYDAGNEERLDGPVLREEGSPPSKDRAADEAYDGLGATWTFFSEVYGRSSIDGHGLPLDGVVHYGVDYDNAFWDGYRMVFGDGDRTIFNRFTVALDVIGHELAHGVTGAEAGLEYLGQPGALNESLSDVFGALVKQHHLGQTADEADWLIGAGLLRPQIKGVALRSMKAPGTAYDDPVLGKDPQPAHMDGFVKTMDDNGGVHINSGIPNHAFYRLATALGGPAWEEAGRVWYEALRDPDLAPDADFSAFAAVTVRHAGQHAHAVSEAWQGVGVDVRMEDRA